MKTVFTITPILLLATSVCTGQSFYCPQNHSYITEGMTQAQVLAACGEPLSKQQSNVPATQKVPVQQLVYPALNQGSVYPGLDPAFYTQWSLPSGTQGILLRVDVMNNKVSGFNINGSDTNAMSLCGGTTVNIGDNVSAVYNACGNPSLVNNTFINQPLPTNSKPEVWIYQIDQYQPPYSLTFVNGKLQSIN